MTENIMQCCYTNAELEVAGTKSSGWQPVAVTDNIPADAYTNCVNLLNANSTIRSKMEDEMGNLLNLFEINSDGSYVYVSRTQYGLLDRLGRPNMFAHGYIFSWKREDVLCDPNVFLTLKRENFVADVETANAPKAQLLRNAPYTLSRAMEVAGIGPEAYVTLIHCVYAQYSERKAAKPIYVQYDGTEEQMQAILYCIYYGIPHHMRRNLSVSSAVSETSESKNLIFSRYASRQSAYVVPQNGENNILTPRAQRKISRYGFVDHAARSYDSIDVSEYFLRLERTAVELGDPTASNELILKIAHQMIMGIDVPAMTNEELDGAVSDALRSKSYGSAKMEGYISEMLDEFRSRKLFLTEESEANLMDRLTNPATARLTEAGEAYNFYRFSAMSVEEAAQLLSNMTGPIFDSYCQQLAKSPKGLQILDHYFANHYIQGRTITWELLNFLLDDAAIVTEKPKTMDMVDIKAWDLYNSQLAMPGYAPAARDALLELMCRMYGQEHRENYDQTARETYWDKQTFEDFRYDALQEYVAMSNASDKCNMFAYLHSVVDTLKHYGDEEFLKHFNRCVAENRQYIVDNNLLKTLLTKVQEEAVKLDPEAIKLANWLRVAAQTPNEALFTEMLSLENRLRAKDYKGFVENYRSLAERLTAAQNGLSVLKNLSKPLTALCSSSDSEEWPIPLDVWLVLGQAQFENCFQVLPTLQPAILQMDEIMVVHQSKLLATEPYISLCEDYIQEKTPEAKIVRKWLAEVRDAEKRRRSEEKKAAKAEAKAAKAEAKADSEGNAKSFMSRFTEEKPAKPEKPATEPAPEKKNKFRWFGNK